MGYRCCHDGVDDDDKDDDDDDDDVYHCGQCAGDLIPLKHRIMVIISYDPDPH